MTDIVKRLQGLATNGDGWTRPVATDALAEIERLRAALRDTHQVLRQARLYLGYSPSGPLNTPFAHRAEKQAHMLLKEDDQ